MKLILIIEPLEGQNQKFAITQLLPGEAEVLHQWQFLQRKFPNTHVEALRLSPTRLVLKVDAP